MLKAFQQEPFLICIFGGALEAMAIEGRFPGFTLQERPTTIIASSNLDVIGGQTHSTRIACNTHLLCLCQLDLQLSIVCTLKRNSKRNLGQRKG
jgi:hypothetical protein